LGQVSGYLEKRRSKKKRSRDKEWYWASSGESQGQKIRTESRGLNRASTTKLAKSQKGGRVTENQLLLERKKNSSKKRSGRKRGERRVGGGSKKEISPMP